MNSKFKNIAKKHFPHLIPVLKVIIKNLRIPSSRRHVRRLLKERKEIWIELGAGNKGGQNGWTTIDITKDCDIFWDLRNGIPFPNRSIKKIYSSHLFEHLTYKDGQKLFEECKRVLAPSGKFSICVPNARVFAEAYVSGKLNKKFFGYQSAYNNTTKADYLNYIAYMDGQHNYMFDEENLVFILKKAGFKKAQLREFDPGLDLKTRDFESIYAEALK